MSETDLDIAIIGGGMAGATLALALSGHGLRIGLIEARQPQADALPNYDDRAIALALASQRIFQSLGLWQSMQGAAEPISNIHVSERGGFGFAHLQSTQEGVPALGYVINARALGHALLEAVRNRQDIQVIAPACLTAIKQNQHQIQLTLTQDGQTVQLNALLAAAADGTQSAMRAMLGLPLEEWHYGQSAVIANLSTSNHHQGTAYERFSADGPMALLPLKDGHSALVWTVRDERLPEVLALDDQAFMAEVQDRFGWRLGRITQVGKRSQYPLLHLRALKSVGNRAVLVGNAAHCLHPVAGQGFNLGIRDVATLAELVVKVRQQGDDIGAESLLMEYEVRRQPDQKAVAWATDSLVRLFTNPLPGIGFARNLGLLALDAVLPCKHGLAKAAMGLHGSPSRLIRGLTLE